MIDRVLSLLITSLAVWRITSLLYREDGPWDVFARFRKWVGVYYDEQSSPQGRNVIAQVMTCAWCLSVWVAFPFVFLVHNNPANLHIIMARIIDWLALSALAIVIDECVKKG